MEIHRHLWFKEQRGKGVEGMPRFSASYPQGLAVEKYTLKKGQ